MLAERLGMTVAELGERMTGEELSTWMAFDDLNAQVAIAIRDGVDPKVAAEAVWKVKGE